MNKIFIIGIVASGKTTLARQISQELNIPWYELDTIVHNQTVEGRVKVTPDEQMQVIMNIDHHGKWIFEGTDRKSYQYLYGMADRIIFLDPPLRKRRVRIILRFIKQKLGIEKCHYKPTLEMLREMFKWTDDFEKNRGEFEAKLMLYGEKVIRLRNTKSIIKW
jgi:adenylate kinase family enzyme